MTDDVIYIGSQEAKLLALDRQNGTLRWSFPGDNDEGLEGIYGSPAVTDELIFVGAYGKENGTLYALNPITQGKQWEFTTKNHIVGSPTVAGDTVFVGSSDGTLYALDAAQGTLKWQFQTDNKIWSTPVVYEDTVYFGSLDHNVYAVTLIARRNLNLIAGDEIWRFPTKGAVASTPLVMDGRVYIGSFDSRFYALDAGTGAQVWEVPFKANSWFWTKAVSDGDTIYVGSLDGNLYALDIAGGNEKWRFETDDPIISAPALVPEGVVVANDKGDLSLVRVQDGQEIRSFSAKDHIRAPLAAPSPDSVIYFSAMDHSVRAADLEDGFWKPLWCYDTKNPTTQCG